MQCANDCPEIQYVCKVFSLIKTMIEHKAYYYKVPTSGQKHAGIGHLK